MIVTRLLGLRIEFGNVIVDPVIPLTMNGLEASMDFLGHAVTFRYTVEENCYGPKFITINEKAIPFSNEDNKYRHGGAVIPVGLFIPMLDSKNNVIEIRL
jgi:cellobiose phosphorylase